MKIKAGLLKKFLRKINSTNQIEEALFNFGENGFAVNAMAADNSIFVKGNLKKEAFATYEEMGDLAVGNISNLVSYLDKFGDEEVEISTAENLIVFKAKAKKLEMICPAPEFLEKPKEVNVDEFKVVKKINSDFLLSSRDNLRALGEDIYKVVIKDKKLNIQAGTKNRFTETMDFDVEEDFALDFGTPLTNVLNVIDSKEVELNLANNYPMKLVEESDAMKIDWIVAPRNE